MNDKVSKMEQKLDEEKSLKEEMTKQVESLQQQQVDLAEQKVLICIKLRFPVRNQKTCLYGLYVVFLV